MVPNRTLIAGCGNPLRGDDGIGSWVVQQMTQAPLQIDLVPNITAFDLFEKFQIYEKVFVIDSAFSRVAKAGDIWCFDGLRQLPGVSKGSSSHDLGLKETLDLASIIGSLPRSLILFLIMSKNFKVGSSVGKEVQESGRLLARWLSLFNSHVQDKELIMHEHQLIKKLIHKIEEVVRVKNGRHVEAVRLRVGALSHITPDIFLKQFMAEADNQVFAGVRLEIVISENIRDADAQSIVLESVVVS